MASHSAAVVTARYTRGAQLSVVIIAAGWHLATDLPATLGALDRLRWPGAVLAAWVIFAAVGAIGAVGLLGDRPVPVLPLLGALLAADVVVLAASPRDLLFSAADWGWGAVGWFAMIVLWHRPIGHFLAVLGANAALSLGAVLAAGGGNRVDLGRWAMVIYGTSALQLALKAGSRALNTAAAQAADAAAAIAALEAGRAAAAQVHRGRRDRYRDIRAAAGALLADLAAGRADPADPELRRRCTVEASRLRRLIAESDEVPDPLLHELRACADLAERRAVVVELVSVGRLPGLAVPVRRALTEPVARVLATARTHARVTVAGDDDTVAVSILADGGAAEPGADGGAAEPGADGAAAEPGADGAAAERAGADPAGVTVTVQDEGGRRWVEARWRRR